ncbi:M23 family metallopeptidase [Candidatus Parcubacteria bacterium]|nr:MAG: M23 family metallopeptidase [Candidatus Parcubacteria bacterium]
MPYFQSRGEIIKPQFPSSLLFSKKRFVFDGQTIKIVLVSGIFLLLVAQPAQAQAGILDLIFRLFAGVGNAEIEEKMPVAVPRTQAAGVPVLQAEPAAQLGASTGLALIQANDALAAPLNPQGWIAEGTGGGGLIFVYTVRPGDTISTIAESFGVSVNTILWANNLANARSLKVGSEIVILPVTGIRHEVKKGDTLASIAKQYKADQDDIQNFNGLDADAALALGGIIIVPDGELPAPVASSGSAVASGLPAYQGYYIRPIAGGRRTRGVHGYNGVDLANACGLPVVASAGGSVVLARSSGWNGGYGRYIVLKHSNGTQTLYAHLTDVLVTAGAGVEQGQQIGTIGTTGNSTGCHVHFEIRGARNPF